MKKSKKILFRILPIFILCIMLVSPYVLGLSTNVPNNTDSIEEVDSAANKIWGTVLLILQMAAIAAVVIAGIRYMFASADQKAEIKKSMIGLVIGAILVFAASIVLQFIVNVTNEVVGQ